MEQKIVGANVTEQQEYEDNNIVSERESDISISENKDEITVPNGVLGDDIDESLIE